jgi:uncharacterized protein (DUF983 family)
VLVLRRSLRLACPRCGGTRLFPGWFAMTPACLRCGLRFERAPGYFVGAIYVNYAITAAIMIGAGLFLWRYAGVAPARQLWWWAPFAVLFPVWFFRYSRSLWLGIEYLVNPDH